MIQFNQFYTSNGETLLYVGRPNLDMLNNLANGPGDLWHSGLDQGYKNIFSEIIYQTAAFFTFNSDFEGRSQAVSWRINSRAFAVRQSVWLQTKGFDNDYDTIDSAALDFGFNYLRYHGLVPLYVKNLFEALPASKTVQLPPKDRFMFFRKNFKPHHSSYMLLRSGFWRFSNLKAFFLTRNVPRVESRKDIVPRKLKAISGTPTVSYIIPTMLRQEFMLQLLNDLENQSYLPTEVIIVDATPQDKRHLECYKTDKYSFKLKVVWQTSRGSCRARNEAISLSIGDFLVFGDDDIRIPSDFIENHLRLIQTYGVEACNGMDIKADHQNQTLADLDMKLQLLDEKRWKVGVAQMFSNANSCVSRRIIEELGGNDVNFDGGYGEDSDFGFSIFQKGYVVLHNPFSVNLHLKPPSGGYRFWGSGSRLLGKKRKPQPWELDQPVKFVRPVPSPTIMYGLLKNSTEEQLMEYKIKYFLNYFMKSPRLSWPFKIINLPIKLLQYNRSVYYATKLLKKGRQLK